MSKRDHGGRKFQAKERGPHLHPEAETATHTIQTHNAVIGQVAFPEMLSDGSFKIRFSMKVSLPSRSRAPEISETGVRAQEDVVFHFPASYPMRAPRIYLRHDFNRTLPHFNPMPGFDEGKMVRPCVYEGNLDELLQQYGDGLSEILNHLSEWLGKAAINDLMDPDQGWEPIRRDEILGWMVFDDSEILNIIRAQPKGGGAFFPCKYARSRMMGHYPIARVITYDPFTMRSGLLANMLSYRIPFVGQDIMASATIFAWPDTSSSETKTAGKYLPESITNLNQLIERADEYGCGSFLRSRLGELTWAFNDSNIPLTSFPLFVVLCAARPFRLIGRDSRFELIPYVVECKLEQNLMNSGQGNLGMNHGSEVKPMGHRHALSSELLRRISGVKECSPIGPIMQLGCGSLGSKIVMHLARCGNGPFLLCDKNTFSPHNAARHALVDYSEIPGLPKALLLAREVAQLKQKAVTDFSDILDNCHSAMHGTYQFSNDTRLIIDATGSISVREALTSLLPAQLPGKLLHAAILAEGEIGVLAIEGPGRNPNVGDLVVRFWDERIQNMNLGAKLGNHSESMQRHAIGQGCSSYTMVMPDARVSLFAAGMAERARQVLEEDPTHSEIWIGMLDEQKMGVSWKRIILGETVVIRKSGWEIRLIGEVADQIQRDALSWGNIETGGALIGNVSVIHRRITISRVVEAPPGSMRSQTQFLLGTQGLKSQVMDVWSRSGGSLTYAGTWHSHPMGGDHSDRDKTTLLAMREHRLGAPCVSLIWTPRGFRALIDDGRISGV